MSLTYNAVFTFINKLFVSLLALLNSVLLARYNSKTGYGTFQTTTSFSSVPSTYLGGFTGYYSYALSKRPDDSISIVQMGNLLVFGVSAIFLIATVCLKNVLFLHIPSVWWWACLGMPLGFVLNYGTKLLQGLNAISWLNRANAIQPLVLLAFSCVLYLGNQGATEQEKLFLTYYSWLLSLAIGGIFAIVVTYYLIRDRSCVMWRFHRHDWMGTVQYGGWLSLANVINLVNYRLDFWFVVRLWPALTSEYSIAVSASEVLLQISSSISSVVFSRMTGGSRDDAIDITQRSSRQTIISSVFVALGMYCFFPWIIPAVYGHRYLGAVAPFLILIPGLIIKSASNVVIQFATNQRGNPKTSIWMNGISALINTVICFLLVPRLKIEGAAIASSASYVVSFLIYVVWFSKTNGVNYFGLFWIRKEDIDVYLKILKRAVSARNKNGTK